METDVNAIRAVVRALILDSFCVPDARRLADETSLLETGVVDLTGVQEVIGSLDGEFRVRVETDEAIPEHLDSVDRLARFIRRKLEAGHGSPNARCASLVRFGERTRVFGAVSWRRARPGPAGQDDADGLVARWKRTCAVPVVPTVAASRVTVAGTVKAAPLSAARVPSSAL